MILGSVVNWAVNSIPVTAIANLAGTVKAYVLSDFAAPTSTVNLNNQKISQLQNGTTASDAVNKSQIDAVLADAKAYADGKIVSNGKVYRSTLTGNGSSTTFDVVHSLGVSNVFVVLSDSSGQFVFVDAPPKAGVTTTTCTITFGSAPASGASYNVLVLG